jgi:selenide,water dikinase
MLTKGGLKAGDTLVLTKPLGTGVTTTALKQEKVEYADIQEAVVWMKRLNKTASQLAIEFGLRAGTDITGFSLLGHSMEMAQASGVSLLLEYSQIPFFSGARKYAEKGFFPGGAFDNKMYYEPYVRFNEVLDEPAQMLLFDPQTSGGLLLGVPEGKMDDFKKRAGELDQPVWVIGSVHDGSGIEVR